ncbi:MAG: cache domain-containing protein, partial [Gammaproteobacteria bacterium]
MKALPFQFRSFRARILVFVLGLLVVLQAAGFLIVNSANTRNALQQIGEALEVTASVFNRSIGERNQRLLEKARLLSADYAFKQAFATHEHETVLSVLDNHQRRIGANVMMLISLDQRVIADTLHPELNGAVFGLPGLIEQAMNSDHGEASSIEIINGNPYQLVIVPLYAPGPSAWIVIGFSIGDSFAESLQATTKSEVSLLRREKQKAWVLIASTLSVAERDRLSKTQFRWPDGNTQSVQLDMGGREYVSLLTPLSRGDEKTILAVLQRDLRKALRPHMRLRVVLIALFSGGLVLSLIGGFLIARTVTRPVLALAKGARSIEEGDYTYTVPVKQQDEIGMLANTFNQMAKGLGERDRVRNLLGKVVSPAIAEKLLSTQIELGGEEREVTVLFADVRKFTELCENRSPTDILSLLNRYLTQITSVVESNGGVVDKYVGD